MKGKTLFGAAARGQLCVSKMADQKNIIYATPQDIGGADRLLKRKAEMLKESYTALVDQNKDNSDESRWV